MNLFADAGTVREVRERAEHALVRVRRSIRFLCKSESAAGRAAFVAAHEAAKALEDVLRLLG